MSPSEQVVLGVAVAFVVVLLARYWSLQRERASKLADALRLAPDATGVVAVLRWIRRCGGGRRLAAAGMRVDRSTGRLVVEEAARAPVIAAALAQMAGLQGDRAAEAHAAACAQRLLGLCALRQRLVQLARTPYDRDSDEHEKMLEEIWSCLQGSRERTGGRLSSDWEDIGFQGKDPATDFRGSGELGLRQLHSLVRVHRPFAIAQVAQYAVNPHRHYPLAITSINATGWFLELAAEGTLDDDLLWGGCDDAAACHVHHALLQDFADAWDTKRPDSILEFGRVANAWLQDVRHRKQRGELLVDRGGLGPKS